ncbi:MAG: protease inhibitor I42 family protein [Methanoregula sp.]
MDEWHTTGMIVTLAILAVVLSAAGCLGQTYGSGNNGSTIRMAPGDTAVISLAENPSTGFVWNVTTTGDIKITGDGYSSGNPIGELMGMVGSGGSRTWHISIGNDPIQTFSADLRRPGEPVNRTLRSFEITFIVP